MLVFPHCLFIVLFLILHSYARSTLEHYVRVKAKTRVPGGSLGRSFSRSCAGLIVPPPPPPNKDHQNSFISSKGNLRLLAMKSDCKSTTVSTFFWNKTNHSQKIGKDFLPTTYQFRAECGLRLVDKLGGKVETHFEQGCTRRCLSMLHVKRIFSRGIAIHQHRKNGFLTFYRDLVLSSVNKSLTVQNSDKDIFQGSIRSAFGLTKSKSERDKHSPTSSSESSSIRSSSVISRISPPLQYFRSSRSGGESPIYATPFANNRRSEDYELYLNRRSIDAYEITRSAQSMNVETISTKSDKVKIFANLLGGSLHRKKKQHRRVRSIGDIDVIHIEPV